MGLLDQVTETLRRSETGDDKYVKRLLYFFELRVPEGSTESDQTSYTYPLILPPTSIRISEPFAVEQAFTVDGGLYVEENGILARELTIEGNTGFRPRENKGQSDFDLILPTERASFTRKLTRKQTALIRALSGQRHFQFLQDHVFRVYGDLKRDPATSEGTELYFHNSKDDEHWRCVPLEFGGDRSGDAPVSYPYTFKLLLVEGVKAVEISEDKAVLDFVKDAYRMTKYGVGLIRAGLQDLSEVTGEINSVIQGGAVFITEAEAIATATENFLDGVDKIIKSPLAGINRTKSAMDASLAVVEKAAILGSSGTVPGSLINTIRKIQDGMSVISSYPENFQTSIQAAVESFNTQQSLSLSRTSVELQAAEDAGAPQTVRAFGKLGTGLLPGDRRRASDELGLGRNVARYTSAVERDIGNTDTIVNLAAKYMGDARKWKILAIFNALQPPYISPLGLHGTLAPGDKILIPNFAKSDRRRASPATLGVPVEAAAQEHFLGTDFLLEDVGNAGQADLAVDVEGGSTDFKISSGIPNLQQALRSRLRTERGSDILFRNLGVRRVVGIGITPIDLEQAQFSLIETVQTDPRISLVRNLRFTNAAESPDVLDVEIDAAVRGFTRPEKIRVSVQ